MKVFVTLLEDEEVDDVDVPDTAAGETTTVKVAVSFEAGTPAVPVTEFIEGESSACP